MSLPSIRILVAINLLALTSLAYLWIDQRGYLRPIIWVAPAPVKAVISSVPAPSPDEADNTNFTATLERPIFAPDRRPPPPVLPPPPPPPPDPMAGVQLLGLFSGQVSGALIRAEGRIQRINMSQKLGEWTLQAIEDRSITFKKVDETRVVKLEYARLNVPVSIAASQPLPETPGVAAGAAVSAAIVARNQEEAEKARIREQIRARSASRKP